MPKKKDSYITFFPADWMTDTELRLLPLEARGLWIDMLCIMHQSETGYSLVSNGRKICAKSLSLLAHISPEKTENLLKQIIEAGVCSVDEDGVIYSRRLLRDKELREKRAKAGSKGGKKTQKNILLKQDVQANSGDGDGDGDGDKKNKNVCRKPCEFSDDVERIYSLLCDAFKSLDENSKAVPKTSSAREKAKNIIRLLIERDKRPMDEVEKVIDFMVDDYHPENDGFPGWGVVTRSFAKFRKNYEKMRPCALQDRKKAGSKTLSSDEYDKIKDDILF
jgi:hypothetical protein